MQWAEFRRHIEHFPEADLQKIEKAFELGKKMHDGQKRKSGEPYFTHPIAVAKILISWGADRDTIIAALLHDTVEDTPVVLEEIETKFGKTVATLVDGVTKLNKEDLANSPNLDRRVETLRKMFTLMQQDVRMMVIKLADRLHNMQTISFRSVEKQKMVAHETLDIYIKIANRLSMSDVCDELEALCLEILEPDTLKKLRDLRSRNERQRKEIALKMSDTLATEHKSIFQKVEIQPEFKTWDKLRQNIQSEGFAVTGLAAVTVAFICENIDTCYLVMGALHQTWQRETLSFQDYINSPKLNGYEGLHTTIILQKGLRVRCKIRTAEMQEYAHKGITIRCFKKNPEAAQTYLPWTTHISTLTSETQNRSSQQFWDSLQSDILGESITVHGPDDTTSSIPKDSTALDGAFFLFGKFAPRISGIRVNGTPVSLNHLLQYGDSLSIELVKESRLTLDWLDFVHTGFAIAEIRRTLREYTDEKKEKTGRALFQKFMLERQKGFLSEYEEKYLNARVEPLGFVSFHRALLALADGDMNISTLYDALFSKNSSNSNDKKMEECRVRLLLPNSSQERENFIHLIHTNFHPHSLTIKRDGKARESLSMKVRMTVDTQLNAARKLQLNGARSVRIESMQSIRIGLILGFLLMLLWGLDPVFAHAILQADISPIDFTIIRLVSVFLIAVVAFGISCIKDSFSPLPLKNASIWIAGLSFFAISLLTYIALQHGSPSLYNSILRGNILFFGLASFMQSKKRVLPPASTLAMMAGYGYLIFVSGFSKDVLASLGVLGAFFIYTISSTRFQKQEKVLARYPQFFLYTSGIALLCISLIVTKSTLLSMPMKAIGAISLYSACFIGAPYFIFFWLTKKYGYTRVSPWIALSLIVTFVGEAILYGLQSVTYLIPAAILLFAGSLFSAREMHLTKEQ